MLIQACQVDVPQLPINAELLYAYADDFLVCWAVAQKRELVRGNRNILELSFCKYCSNSS